MHDLAFCTIDIYMYGLFSCIYLHEWPILLIFTCTAYFPVYIHMYGLFSCIYLHELPIFLYTFTHISGQSLMYLRYLHAQPFSNQLTLIFRLFPKTGNRSKIRRNWSKKKRGNWEKYLPFSENRNEKKRKLINKLSIYYFISKPETD